MIKKLAILLPLSVLAACAYTLDREYQAVTLQTTGAQNSVCNVWADKIRYKFYPPETRNIKNADEDLIIKCYAAGNRYREVVIKPRISGNTYKNVLNGLAPGVFVDYTSGSMFLYPDTIDIDFTHIPARAMEPPAHNNMDILNPENNYLEEFRPGHPRMNEDRFHKEQPLLRRIRPGSDLDAYSSNDEFSASSGTPLTSDEKGELMQVFENLGTSMNPSQPESNALPTGPDNLSAPSNSALPPAENGADMIVIEPNDVMNDSSASDAVQETSSDSGADDVIDESSETSSGSEPQPLFPLE